MTPDYRDALSLQLGFPSPQIPALRQYMSLLWSANEELNLFSRQMPHQELIDNHLIDCLLPLSLLPQDLKVMADFGSGGGLPGVIYALARPHTQVQLYEKSPKKREFLSKCRTLAPNLEVFGEIPLELANVELITARAFKPLDVILDLSRNYYKKKGRYFLLKGRLEKINEEILLSKKKFKDLKVEVKALQSPLMNVERNLVLI